MKALQNEDCRMKTASLGFALLLVALAAVPAGALTASEVARELSCRCGCSMTVDGCNHTNCPFAVPARRTIEEKIAQGMGKEAIIQSFVAQYGEVVLAAPTKTGFNLTAWVVPFVMLLVGGGIVRAVVKRWSRPGARPVPGEQRAPSGEGQDADYRAKMEKELKELDR